MTQIRCIEISFTIGMYFYVIDLSGLFVQSMLAFKQLTRDRNIVIAPVMESVQSMAHGMVS